MPRFARPILAAALLSAAGLGQAAPLTNGVAAGDVSQTEATLWAKADTAGTLTFQLATDASFSKGLRTSTRSIADASVPAHQNVTGLTAGQRYYYRVTDAGGNVSQGSFVTPHAAGRQGLRFGVSGDWRNAQAPFVATSNVDERNLDFFVALGDTSYTDRPEGAPATTLPEFRMKHSEQLTARNGINAMVEIRQSTALIAMIDDHEVRDDFAGGAPISSDPRFAGTGAPDARINTSSLYQAGLEAFQDYMPIERRFVGGSGDPALEGRPDLYRSQRFGKDAHVIVPDARSFRDTPLAATLTPEQTLAAAFEPGRTMLGSQQVSRLKADLLDAQTDGVTWKFVMVPEPIQNLGPVNARDRFEGYAAERTEILEFIKQNDIRNVVFVSADIHGTVMNDLTYQEVNGTDPSQSFLGPQVKVKSFEITTGPGAYNDMPFGPQVVTLALAAGLISQSDVDFYQSLPVAPDADDLPNDKDDFVRAILEEQLSSVGYSPIGLDDSGISFDLMSGDWVMAHLFGWTEFEIDAATQDLLITVWGLDFQQVLAALGDPAALAALTPQIFAQLLIAAEGVPEPATVGLFGLGIGALGLRSRRRRHGRAATG